MASNSAHGGEEGRWWRLRRRSSTKGCAEVRVRRVHGGGGCVGGGARWWVDRERRGIGGGSQWLAARHNDGRTSALTFSTCTGPVRPGSFSTCSIRRFYCRAPSIVPSRDLSIRSVYPPRPLAPPSLIRAYRLCAGALSGTQVALHAGKGKRIFERRPNESDNPTRQPRASVR